MSNLKYRPEIDGLRAVAVLGVVLFHIGLGFPGGYVGVDVFFVISGFLITGIILKDLRLGTFSLLNFWVRRIRRILPAVSVMVVVTLVMGYVLLTPDAFSKLAKSSIAQSLMASNVFFWRDTGYFTENADFKPLLHTWSLAVEEQFYVFFPLILCALWKSRQKSIAPIMLVVGLASLLLSCYGTRHYPQAAFFMLASRAWEMLAGGLLVLWSGKKTPSHGLCEVISWGGLMMIAIAMGLFNSNTLFPGWAALLPVGGTVLFIGANKNRLTSAGKLLAFKPAVFVGLISYSLYLWHWPILAFARNVIIDIDLKWKIALLFGSFVLAVLSWRFVEIPFRNKKVLATKFSAFTFAAVSTALLLAVSFYIWKTNGVPSRVESKMAPLVEDIDWTGSEYLRDGSYNVYLGLKPIKGETKDREVDFVLWGDSHGMVVAATVDKCATIQGLRGMAYLTSGTPPVTGLWKYSSSEMERHAMLEENELVVRSIIKQEIKNVILVGRWAARCDGLNAAELESSHSHIVAENPMVIDRVRLAPTPEISAQVLARQLRLMTKRFKNAGVKVWLLKQVPEANLAQTAKNVYMLKRFPSINVMDEYSTTLIEHRQRQANANMAIESLPIDQCNVIDPTPKFFEQSGKLKIYGDRSYYRDDDHLTRYGVDHYLTDIFNKTLTSIKKNLKLTK